MPVSLAHDDTSCLIRLEGETSISSASELKAQLAEALISGKEVRVELEHATELDITALQLLWAAGQQASASRVAYSLVGTMPQAITALLAEAGFENFPLR
jgi:anti-anti-sigma regulatory factor